MQLTRLTSNLHQNSVADTLIECICY